MPGEGSSGGGERGIALLLVVWLLALLAVITVAITADARTGLRIARNQVDGAQAQAVADAGIWWGTARMGDPDRAAHLRPDGTAYQVMLGGQRIEVTVQDERGKFDINEASVDALANLFGQVGVDASVAQAIGRYRDRLRPAVLEGGAQAGNKAPAAKRVAFAALEDLRLVEGLTPDDYVRMLPFLTAYTGEARVNPMTAPVEVLRSLPGLDRSAIEEQIRRRSAPAEKDGRDRLVTGAGGIAALTWAEANLVTIRSVAHMPSGAAFVREAVLELEPGSERPFRVLAWRHGRE
jgi:general secretion pathway protein K